MSSKLHNSAQMALAIALDDKASFDNFFIADNAELLTAIKSLVQQTEHSMMYFYGVTGSGKSHLLFALQRLAKQMAKASNYLSLADQRVTTDLLEVVDVGSIVCIDDIQAWLGDDDSVNEAKERALFALFERIKQADGQLLVSATQPPDLCGFKLKDLVSRLASGLVYPLHALDDAQQFDALRLRANQRGLSISDEAIKYLVTRSSRDSGALFALLDRIDQASLIEKRRITIPFLQTLELR